MVDIKIKFVCDKCGSEKSVEISMNYKLYQEYIEGGDLPNKLYLPKNWAYEETTKNNYTIECKKCLNKWKRENNFIPYA
jgi:transcription elongation factor Elf1